jgi:hypothetical protein
VADRGLVRVLPAARRENGIELGPLSARDFTSARDSEIESLASRLTDKIAAHIHERMSEKPKFGPPFSISITILDAP